VPIRLRHLPRPDRLHSVSGSPTGDLIREIAYCASGLAPRDARAALSELAHHRRVSLEDKALIERVQAAWASMQQLHLRALERREVCLRSFARRMRALIPESVLPRARRAGGAVGEGRRAALGVAMR